MYRRSPPPPSPTRRSKPTPMSTSDRSMRASWLIALALATSSACTVFDEEILPPPPECTTNAECTIKLTGDSATPIPGMCVKGPEARCVQLTSEDCTVVTGNYLDDDAVLIASLLSTTGAQAATNLPRQQAAIMAVEQINSTSASGGILQSKAPGDARKLVMVSCDEIANLPRVATHLVTDLRVTAIVGPNLSQDTLDLTTGNPEIGLPSSAQAGVALLSPTAVASAIATIPDNGLSFMMPAAIGGLPLMKTRSRPSRASSRRRARSRRSRSRSLLQAIPVGRGALVASPRSASTTRAWRARSSLRARPRGRLRRHRDHDERQHRAHPELRGVPAGHRRHRRRRGGDQVLRGPVRDRVASGDSERPQAVLRDDRLGEDTGPHHRGDRSRERPSSALERLRKSRPARNRSPC